MVGELRSLHCEKVGVRVRVTGRERWRPGELGSVREGEAMQVVMFSPSTERVDLSRLWVVVLDSDTKAYSLSSPLRAPSR